MDWKPRPRKYDLERNRLNHLNREGVLSHPLKTSLLPKTSSTTSKSETALAKNHSNSKLISHKSEFEDPLSRFAAEASIQIDGEVNGKRKSSHDLASDPGNHVTSNEGKLTRGPYFVFCLFLKFFENFITCSRIVRYALSILMQS